MKKYIVALAIGSVAFMSNVQAQSGKQRMTPQEQTDKMTTDLGLNDDQKAKVLAVNTDASKKMETLKASGEDKDAMKADRKKIEDAKEASLKGILTADQFKKYQQERAEAKQSHQK